MKKVISLVLLISILLSTFAGVEITSNAATNGHSQADAVNWAKARANEHWEINDGSGWTQCVELLWAYYEYLIGYHVQGNAYDYLTNKYGACPSGSGWSRPNKSSVQPGDIVVWDQNAYFRGDKTDRALGYGHIGIVVSVNGNSMVTVETNAGEARGAAGYKYNREVSCISGLIRPDFKCKTHTWNKGKVTTKATCTSNGVKTYTCTVCGETKTETIKGGHKYATVLTVKATMATNGVVGKQCSVCKAGVKTTIYHPKSVVSNKLKVTYNGKYQKPGVTVKDIKGNVISSKYYTVSYEKNKYVGFGKITVKFKGLYSGSKTVAFMIVPKGTALKAVKGASSTAINVYWNRQAAQTSGYQIQYSTDSKFSKNNKSFAVKNTTVAKKLTGLKASTKYYFRIRTYKKVNGVPVYSGWSRALSAKTSTPPPTWVKPLNYSWSYHGHNLFAISEKYGKYYCYIDRDWPYYNSGDPSEYCYLYKYTSASADPQKIYLAKNDDDNITSALTDGNGNVYYAQWQFDDGYGTVYRITDNGETSKIFTAKNLTKITGIYGGYIYYIKEIFKSHELADVHFCKYNLKTKKSSTIKKKAWNLYTNTDTRGRYMLFQGFSQDILDTSVTLFDAKTGKAYKITSKGREAHFSGSKIYYSSGWSWQENKKSKVICCDLNGKNKKTVYQALNKYVPICTSSKCMYFYKSLGGGHNNYDFYAYIFKTKKFVKIDPYRNYIVDIQ